MQIPVFFTPSVQSLLSCITTAVPNKTALPTVAYVCGTCPHFDVIPMRVDLRVGEDGEEEREEEVEIILPASDRGGQLCSTFLRKAETTFPAICATSGKGSSARVSTP